MFDGQNFAIIRKAFLFKFAKQSQQEQVPYSLNFWTN